MQRGGQTRKGSPPDLVTVLCAMALASALMVTLHCGPPAIPHSPPSGPDHLREATGALATDLWCYMEQPLVGTPAQIGIRDETGDLCVVVDPDRMAEIEVSHGDDAVLAIYLHELGHIVEILTKGHTTQEGADYYAGCGMARLGRDVKPVKAWLESVGSLPDSRSRAWDAGFTTCLAEGIPGR